MVSQTFNMRVLLSILLAFKFLLSFSQNSDYQISTINSKTIELHQGKQYDCDKYVIVRDSANNEKCKIKLEKTYNSYYFGPNYTGARNFIIIGSRYSFYILDACNEKLIGPFHPKQRSETQDSQSGMLYGYKIIDNGQYLLVNVMDFGVFCYNLLDLNCPKEVSFYKSDSIFFKGRYVFLDLIKENLYDMISASGGNYAKDIEFKFIFKGYKLQQDKDLNVKCTKKDNKYLIFNQIKNKNSCSEIMIDLKTGSLVKNRK